MNKRIKAVLLSTVAALSLGTVASPPAAHAAGLSKTQLLSAKVPSMCGYPAGRLVRGKLPGTGAGMVAINMRLSVIGAMVPGESTGAAATFECNRGGIGWPDVVVVYDKRLNVLGSYNTGSTRYPSGRSTVQSLSIKNRTAIVHSIGIAQKDDNDLWGTASDTVKLTVNARSHRMVSSSPQYFTERASFVALMNAIKAGNRAKALQYGSASVVDPYLQQRRNGVKFSIGSCEGVLTTMTNMLNSDRGCVVARQYPDGFVSGDMVIMQPANAPWTMFKGTSILGIAG